MKYQLIKQLKTKSKQIILVDRVEDMKVIVREKGLRFEGLSYVGGFPMFTDANLYNYSVQGYCELGYGKNGIVCSLDKKVAESFENN